MQKKICLRTEELNIGEAQPLAPLATGHLGFTSVLKFYINNH
jgi:hypothetical protein